MRQRKKLLFKRKFNFFLQMKKLGFFIFFRNENFRTILAKKLNIFYAFLSKSKKFRETLHFCENKKCNFCFKPSF
jgi:hypothetical protein